MKKVLMLLSLMLLVSICQGDTSNRYIAGKTSQSIVFSSSTIPFSITDMSFACSGDYAVVTTSFSQTTNEKIYVDDKVIWNSPSYVNNPISLKGTSQKINIILQPNTTVYYYIGGTK